MIRTVIVDDEPLAREGLAHYVAGIDFLDLKAVLSSAQELQSFIEKEPIDLIYLDIQMPKMNGVDFLKLHTPDARVILTTAYSLYAVEGYSLNVMDYLVKPITADRFYQSAVKAQQYFSLSKQGATESAIDYFFVKVNGKLERILVNDVLFVEGMQNYVMIHTTKGKFITLMNLKTLQGKLDEHLFFRVHKSYLVAINKIDRVEGNQVVIASAKVPVSRNYRGEFMERIRRGVL